MIVVNLFSEPGAGKSTGGSYIFSMLKMLGVNAELVTEFAKDKVWEDTETPFKNQAYIFGNQYFRISRCADKVDVIVTDSPLPLSIVYNETECLKENFNQVVMDVFNSYNNMNYFLHRVKPYNHVGRHENEDEAANLRTTIERVLEERGINCQHINGDIGGYEQVITDVVRAIGLEKGERDGECIC